MPPSPHAAALRRKSRWAPPLVALTLFVSLSASPSAFGQTATDSATAETLFNEALALLERENFSEACAKLEASQSLDPGVGTLLYLADCYQQVGRTASAWATFREAAYLAKDKADERESVAIDHASELEPQLSYLTVRVTSPSIEGLELEHNGKPLSMALWGSAFPIDPGPHTLKASAPGKKVWSHTLDIAAGPRKELLLIPELLAADPEPVGVQPARPPRAASTHDTQEAVGWVLLGVGSAAVVTGGVLVLLARSDDASAEAECRPDRIQLCNPAGVELGESAGTKATLAGVSAGLGLAALGAGVTLLLTAPDGDGTPERELRVQASVGDQRGFLSLTSTW